MQRKANHRPYLINESDPCHVAWWAAVLGVSDESLLTAIALVGNESYAVGEYFGIQKNESSKQREVRQRRQDRLTR